jgi:3-oxoadipate enol-lactonase
MPGLQYRLEGRDPSLGPLLVLLHEMGGSLESWDETAALLGDAFTILRYDQRGAGRSDKPQAMLTLADHVADLSGLLEHLRLPLPAAFCGVAAGAALAVAFALQRPAAVAKLVLCAPALAVDPSRRQYLNARADQVVREGMAAIAEASLANSYPPIMRRDADAYACYRARFLANDPVCYGNANRLLAVTDLEPQLPQLGMPCLVLSGRHDGMRPPDQGRAVAARIPGATFDLVDSGHLMPVQAGAALAQRLRRFFLAT